MFRNSIIALMILCSASPFAAAQQKKKSSATTPFIYARITAPAGGNLNLQPDSRVGLNANEEDFLSIRCRNNPPQSGDNVAFSIVGFRDNNTAAIYSLSYAKPAPNGQWEVGESSLAEAMVFQIAAINPRNLRAGDIPGPIEDSSSIVIRNPDGHYLSVRGGNLSFRAVSPLTRSEVFTLSILSRQTAFSILKSRTPEGRAARRAELQREEALRQQQILQQQQAEAARQAEFQRQQQLQQQQAEYNRQEQLRQQQLAEAAQQAESQRQQQIQQQQQQQAERARADALRAELARKDAERSRAVAANVNTAAKPQIRRGEEEARKPPTFKFVNESGYVARFYINGRLVTGSLSLGRSEEVPIGDVNIVSAEKNAVFSWERFLNTSNLNDYRVGLGTGSYCLKVWGTVFKPQWGPCN